MTPASRANLRRILAAAAALGACGVAAFFVLRSPPVAGERGYWYDLSERRLFVDDARLVPPQPGVGGAPDDAYPAVVVRGAAPSDRTVVFLTSYTEELGTLRRQALEAEARGEPPPEKLGDRLWVTDNTLVRPLDDEQWRPKGSPEGLRILGVLTQRGADGQFPRVCSPDD